MFHLNIVMPAGYTFCIILVNLNFLKYFAQILSGVAALVFGHLAGRARGHDFTAPIAALGTQINDPIHGFYDV